MARRSDLSAAIVAEDWRQATSLAKGVSSQAKTWSKRIGFFEIAKASNLLPLHEACVANAPLAVVAAILNAYPKAARTKESSLSRLPLHCACRRANVDPAIIKLLVNSNTAACLIPDSLGRVPLHYALSNGADPLIVHLLLTAHPNAARAVDIYGWTPLHVACAAGASQRIIVALLHAYPNACIMRTEGKGSRPAQCLPKMCEDREEIKAMLRLAREKFDAHFVGLPQPILLNDNNGAVLV